MKWNFKDVVSGGKLAQLNALLPFKTLPVSQQLPLLGHFIYLNPLSATRDLSVDGYDSYQAPLEPFKRRLWVSGSIEQSKAVTIGLGIAIEERIRRSRQIRDSTIVEIEREISQDGDVCLKEIRKLIYLPDKYVENYSIKQIPGEPVSHERVKLTPLDLFRFSLLTYNSHKIHYDREYAITSEGYPDLLIHGPFIVTLSMNFVRAKNPDLKISRIEYKNVNPLFVTDDLNFYINAERVCWITNSRGVLCYTVTVT